MANLLEDAHVINDRWPDPPKCMGNDTGMDQRNTT
jgi:hypothetical protein